MRTLIVLAAIFGLATACLGSAGRRPLERDYVAAWCTDGQIEYRLPDQTRVDCLTSEYAIEFDYAQKWAEAVGQSLYYAASTNRQPGIVLIVAPGDERFSRRLKILSERHDIRVWLMTTSKSVPAIKVNREPLARVGGYINEELLDVKLDQLRAPVKGK